MGYAFSFATSDVTSKIAIIEERFADYRSGKVETKKFEDNESQTLQVLLLDELSRGVERTGKATPVNGSRTTLRLLW